MCVCEVEVSGQLNKSPQRACVKCLMSFRLMFGALMSRQEGGLCGVVRRQHWQLMRGPRAQPLCSSSRQVRMFGFSVHFLHRGRGDGGKAVCAARG